MRDVEDAIKVDGHDVVPVLDHRRGLRAKGMAAIDAGIVDEDRHLPDAFADVLSKLAAGLGVGDVEAEAPGSTAGGGDGRCRGSTGFGIDVEHHHFGALIAVALRDRPADARPGAGDGGDASLKQPSHGMSPLLVPRPITTRLSPAPATAALPRWRRRLPAGGNCS